MPDEPLRALCWIDQPNTSRAVGAILRRCGFEVVGEVTSAAEAVVAAGVTKPHTIVVDIALTGDLGLAAVGALDTVAPGCAVVVVSAFETMRPTALKAGAYEFVGHTDLRVLERCMQRLAGEVHGTLGASSASAAARSGIRSTKAPAS